MSQHLLQDYYKWGVRKFWIRNWNTNYSNASNRLCKMLIKLLMLQRLC